MQPDPDDHIEQLDCEPLTPALLGVILVGLVGTVLTLWYLL